MIETHDSDTITLHVYMTPYVSHGVIWEIYFETQQDDFL